MHDSIEGTGIGPGTLDLYESEADEYEEGSAESAEADETERAGQLLSVGNDEQLEAFFEDLVSSAASAAGKSVGAPVASLLTNALADVARRALPQLGSAVGGMFGGTTGAKIGGDLATSAGKLFGLELEGLSSEDREFEVARHCVRFASDVVKRALAKGGGADPKRVVATAMANAARQHAPGLVGAPRIRDGAPGTFGSGAQSGRWIRRGTKLVLFGV